jgi:hypothetical protein
MLDIQCEEHLDKVIEFAEKRGIVDKLADAMEYLDKYAEHGDRGKTKCVLMSDFAPYSFYFLMQRRFAGTDHYDTWFNGGCIYYGPGDTGVGLPQLSVRLEAATGGDSREEWSIHT